VAVALALAAQAVPPSQVVVGPEVQPPQWVGLLLKLISHPSLNVPLQSARFVAQVETRQDPVPQDTPVMLFVLTEVVQLLPPGSQVVVGPEVQPPQWAALVVVVISQPSPKVPLQSARPAVQVITSQAPAPQLTPEIPFVFRDALQLLPHEPQ
jgi:hypothetical protein